MRKILEFLGNLDYIQEVLTEREYSYFALDMGGIGYIYENKPILRDDLGLFETKNTLMYESISYTKNVKFEKDFDFSECWNRKPWDWCVSLEEINSEIERRALLENKGDNFEIEQPKETLETSTSPLVLHVYYVLDGVELADAVKELKEKATVNELSLSSPWIALKKINENFEKLDWSFDFLKVAIVDEEKKEILFYADNSRGDSEQFLVDFIKGFEYGSRSQDQELEIVVFEPYVILDSMLENGEYTGVKLK